MATSPVSPALAFPLWIISSLPVVRPQLAEVPMEILTLTRGLLLLELPDS